MPHLHKKNGHSVPIQSLRFRRHIAYIVVMILIAGMIISGVTFLILGSSSKVSSSSSSSDSNKETSEDNSPISSEPTSRFPSLTPSVISIPSQTPSLFPTKTVYPSKTPSNTPSDGAITSFPSFLPSREKTVFPSMMTANPSISKISQTPSSNPSLQPSNIFSQIPSKELSSVPSKLVHGQEELKFYVLGDIPYNRKEQEVFVTQLQDIQDLISSNEDSSQFIVHVGDLMSAHFSKCREERYDTISSIMKNITSIPVFTTPGDNEWNRCPDTNLAIANYTKYFIGMEDHWKQKGINSTMITRSTSRSENWFMYHSDVLFVSINMVNDDDLNNISKSTKRLKDNLEWFQDSCDKYCTGARAIIIFGHSISKASAFFDEIHERLYLLNVPVIYFTGDGHKYFIKRGVGKGVIPGNYFWRAQVDNGNNAPPLQITIRSNDAEVMIQDDFFNLDDHQVILADMIKIDRRGGPYSNITT